MNKLFVVLLACLPMQAFGVTVSGVEVPEKAHVQSRQLVLNGAGVRTKFMFKVYVAALYMETKKKRPDEVLVDGGVKRVSLYVMRKLTGGEFMEAFNKAINANHTADQYIPLAARLIHFSRVFRKVGEVNKGDVITLDYSPETGTIVSVNGKEQGRTEGQDFYRALLKIWMGDHPVSDSLKKGMLGA